MARRNPNISLNIDLEADAGSARKDLARDLDKIEGDAKDTVRAIDRAFEQLSPELDTSEIRKALDLAEQLDGMVASMTIDTDLSEIKQAEEIARSLRGFQGRVDLSVEGREELKDALDLAEKVDQIRQVKVQVQGREDLEKAARLAEDLEQRRTVRVDVDDSEIKSAGDRIASELEDGGERGADGISDAIGDIDFSDLGGSARDQFIGSLSAAGPWAAAAGGIASVFGDEFMAGFSDALPAARTDAIRGLRYNLSGPELEEIGTVAAEIYGSGLASGLSQGELRDAVAMVKAELGDIDEDFDLTRVTKEALLLSEVIGVDLTDAISTADALVTRKLVENTSEGLNLLLQLAQETGIEFGEMQELIDEFGPALKAMGIGGTQGFEMMAEIFERRLTPQLDQAGEIFEELNENITNGAAADALERIGLNAEDMTRRVVAGGRDGAAAISEIATAVLAIPDPTERANAAIEIFGGNVNLMGTEARDAIVEIFTMADAATATDRSLSDAVPTVEDTASGLDRLKRVAAELGEELGGTVADGIDTLDKLSKMKFSSTAEEWDSLRDSAQGFGEALLIKVLGPMAELEQRLGIVDQIREDLGLAGEEAAIAGRKFGEGGQGGREFADGATAAAAGARDAAGGMAEAKTATEQLDAALQLFAGRFDEDQIFRRIQEDATAAMEATKGLTAADYDLSTGFNVTTESGRAAEAALEALSLNTDDLAQAFRDGNASAGDLAAGQRQVEGTLRAVASQMGLNQSQTDALIRKYGGVQDEIYTAAIFESGNALAGLLAYQRELGRIPSQKTTTVATHFVTTGTKVFQTGGGFAEGGAVKGGVPIVVGEEGGYGELFVPDTDGTIIPHDETERILNGNPRARALTSAGSAPGGGGGVQRLELVVGSDGSAFGRMVVQAMRKETKNRGGINVVFDN